MMHVLVTGALVGDPAQRTASNGNLFSTANLRVSTEGGDAAFVSLIAFGDRAEDLLKHRQGSTISVAGRAKLTEWVGRDGAAKHGLSVTIEQIASAAAARRAEAAARRRDRTEDGGD